MTEMILISVFIGLVFGVFMGIATNWLPLGGHGYQPKESIGRPKKPPKHP